MVTVEEIKPPTHGDIMQSLDYLYFVFNQYRENGIKWYGRDKPPMDDAEWDEVCTALSYIEDELGVRRNINGNYEVI